MQAADPHRTIAAIWRIDVAPLSRTVLHARDGVWTVRGVNLGLLDSGSD